MLSSKLQLTGHKPTIWSGEAVKTQTYCCHRSSVRPFSTMQIKVSRQWGKSKRCVTLRCTPEMIKVFKAHKLYMIIVSDYYTLIMAGDCLVLPKSGKGKWTCMLRRQVDSWGKLHSLHVSSSDCWLKNQVYSKIISNFHLKNISSSGTYHKHWFNPYHIINSL